METESLKVRVGERVGEISALWSRPSDATAQYVFAHGAGAGMQHAFMEALTERLVARAIAVFRYQFPYMEAGSRRPDVPRVLEATVRTAVRRAGEVADGLPQFAGGKSMGGRMTSRAVAEAAGSAATTAEEDNPLHSLKGLIFVGFPLHPAGKPGTDRADHLRDVSTPMLFLQGTRDKLAEMDLLRSVTDPLKPATVQVVEGADHGFHVLKRSGRTDDEVLDELADSIRGWIDAR